MKFEVTYSGGLYCCFGDVEHIWITRDELMSVLVRVLFNPRTEGVKTSATRLDKVLFELERTDGLWLIRQGEKFHGHLTQDEMLAVVTTILYTGKPCFPLLNYEQYADRFPFLMTHPVTALIRGPR